MKLREIKLINTGLGEIICRSGWVDVNANFAQIAEAISVKLEQLDVGVSENDGKADSIRNACMKINRNFRAIEARLGAS